LTIGYSIDAVANSNTNMTISLDCLTPSSHLRKRHFAQVDHSMEYRNIGNLSLNPMIIELKSMAKSTFHPQDAARYRLAAWRFSLVLVVVECYFCFVVLGYN